jgi:hypothetical protein
MTNHAAVALAGLAVLAAPHFASATTNVSINTASYSYASWDTSGDSIANNIAVASSDGVSNNDVGFWTATYSFNLTSANDLLTITDLAADDRVVVELNGHVVDAAGIYGPGEGTMIFTPTGAQVSQDFNANSQAAAVTDSSYFLAGANTLELIVNNTNNGIYGGLTGGPSSLYFSATVAPAGVPEPTTWALMLSGVALSGAALRRRRASSDRGFMRRLRS